MQESTGYAASVAHRPSEDPMCKPRLESSAQVEMTAMRTLSDANLKMPMVALLPPNVGGLARTDGMLAAQMRPAVVARTSSTASS